MKFSFKWNLYFWKAHDKSYPKIQFLSILDKYFKRYGNINAIWPLFGMGSTQIWPCHVTQATNLSFPYLISYCPLNFRKSHRISWFCCIPNGSYKEDNLKEGRICPPPMWNRVKIQNLQSLRGLAPLDPHLGSTLGPAWSSNHTPADRSNELRSLHIEPSAR